MNARPWIAALVLATIAGCAQATPVSTTTPTCATAKSDAEANKAVVLRYFDEAWNKKSDDAGKGIVAEDLVNHAAIPEAQGFEGLRTIHRKLLAAFPDITIKPVDVVAEGDRVVVRTVTEGTLTGALEFKERVPATGKHVRIEQVFMYRVKDGKIVESWMTMDRADWGKQLGVGRL
jgi:steroid delta-isomerase-like uncharacterized protein